MTKANPKKSKKVQDDFESVAKRLGYDPGLKKFDKNLGKIAPVKNKPQTRKAG